MLIFITGTWKRACLLPLSSGLRIMVILIQSRNSGCQDHSGYVDTWQLMYGPPFWRRHDVFSDVGLKLWWDITWLTGGLHRGMIDGLSPGGMEVSFRLVLIKISVRSSFSRLALPRQLRTATLADVNLVWRFSPRVVCKRSNTKLTYQRVGSQQRRQGRSPGHSAALRALGLAQGPAPALAPRPVRAKAEALHGRDRLR